MSSSKSQNLLAEIKKYFKTVNQLNILLKETTNACKDTKLLQKPAHLLENIQLNENDEEFLKSLKGKKICLVVLGQNVLSKSLIVNELLSRYLLPFQINSELSQENWRFIRIKHGKIPGFSYQLVDSDFEVMTSDGKQAETSPVSAPCSSTFTLSLDDVRTRDSLCQARRNFELAESDKEREIAVEQIKQAESNAENQAILEITLDHKLLEQNFEILIHNKSISQSSYEKLIQNSIVIYVYSIIDGQLNEADLAELTQMQQSYKNEPIFFVKIPEVDKYIEQQQQQQQQHHHGASPVRSPSSANQHHQQQQQLKKANNFLKYLQNSSQNQTHNSLAIFGQLYNLKNFNIIPSGSGSSSESDFFDLNMLQGSSPLSLLPFNFESEFCEKWHLFLPNFLNFLKRYLELYLVRGTKILFKFHQDCLKQLINFAFEVARDMLVTPRKIEYARDKEHVLFESLNTLASIKQEELKNLINNAIETNKESILEAARSFEFNELDVELVQEASEQQSAYTTVKYARDYKKCSSQIQELVINKLNSAISLKLTQSVEILKENYYGTLKRCLINLEDVNNQVSSETGSAASVSDALQQILNSAYKVDVNLSGSTNILKMFLQKMKELVNNMPWSSSPRLDDEWKVSIANNMLENLSEAKLAKILCNQMKDKLKTSHCQFTYSLKMLEAKHTGRLEKNEENQSIIRKVLAPKFAKLGLESTSLEDYVLYGFPTLGKEIGRGQYGVVYSCHKWGKFENLAVKSVVPPDEKHWNDLALEFHYTKQIADHDRIVKLIGSVIDYTYGNGNSPAVLLIMEAMKRDLYQALKSGLDWKSRLQISIDVVEGIRYLHGLGLIHRDIKLKNVLLDLNNRAKITDLGFCKPNAMISGSIVGTPVHMCPKMFDAKYDNSVDIYAFGILFWYICAGSVSLPKNFEQCSTKDDLWSSVKRGVRPERLVHFDQDCWNLMELCWHHEPKSRPHIGEVAIQLDIIKKKYLV